MPAAAASTNGILRGAHLGLLFGGIGLIILAIVLRVGSGDDTLTTIETWVGLAAILAGAICGLVLLYRSYRCLVLADARFGLRGRSLDPGTAVALCAIPLVNLVGFFVVLGPMPGRLNRAARAAGVRSAVTKDLGYATAVLMVLSAVPIVGILFALAGGVLFPILIFRCSKLADAIEPTLQAAAAPS